MITINQTKACGETELVKKLENYLVLFATAIVNPNGPTFDVYCIDPEADEEGVRVYQVNMHPTSESIQEVARVFSEDKKQEFNKIEFYSDFFNASMPTLFLHGQILNDKLYKSLIAKYIDCTNDSMSTYHFVKDYEGNPFKRVSAEMNSAFDSILKSKSAPKVSILNRIFGRKKDNKNEFDKELFIRMLTKENNVIEEIKALFMAYNGSIENVIPKGMVQINFKAFVDVFVTVALQCEIDPQKLNFR